MTSTRLELSRMVSISFRPRSSLYLYLQPHCSQTTLSAWLPPKTSFMEFWAREWVGLPQSQGKDSCGEWHAANAVLRARNSETLGTDAIQEHRTGRRGGANTLAPNRQKKDEAGSRLEASAAARGCWQRRSELAGGKGRPPPQAASAPSPVSPRVRSNPTAATCPSGAAAHTTCTDGPSALHALSSIQSIWNTSP